ncbi:MAG: hypothetical protein JW786_14240 [Desulfobacterales bacterium]|nr:hypothetical protein [Desulfobacterales bacterium]
MIKKIPKKIKCFGCIFFLTSFFLTSFVSWVSAAEQDVAYLLELVNEIRLDPFTRAEALGYDRIELAQNLPWLKTSYEPYTMDNFLCFRAEVQNSLDEEISESLIPPEHDYARTGKTGAVVCFFNFIPLKSAFRIIVENMLRQELNPDSVEQPYLLSNDFNRIGVYVKPGVQALDGRMQNAYFVTFFFGSSRLKSEVQILTMVNQVRFQPVSVAAYLGVSLIELLDNNLDFLSEWYKAYPPLMDDSILAESAQSYSRQLVDLGEDSLWSAASTPLLRALDMGYDGFELTESVAVIAHPVNETSEQIAGAVFSSLIREELKAVPERGGVFSLGTSDGGIGIAFASVDDQIEIVGSVLDAGVAAVDDDEAQAAIYGVVYSDNDGNKIYSPGEGHGSASVVVFRKSDHEIVKKMVTDNAGHFSMTLVNHEMYQVEISAGEATASLEIILDQNLFLPVNLKSFLVSS